MLVIVTTSDKLFTHSIAVAKGQWCYVAESSKR